MRVLLVRLSSLGDVVHGLGAAAALAQARPDWQFHWVVQREFAPLFAGLEPVHVVPHQRRPALRGFVRTAQALRALHCDVALDLQGNWKSAAICRAAGIRRRIGAAAAARREPASRILLNECVVGATGMHPAGIAWALARALLPNLEPRPPRVVATAAEVAAEAAHVRQLGIDPDQPFRVLVATRADDPRSWWPQAMRREADAAGPPALWLLGPAEAELATPSGVGVLQHGRGELRRLVALGALLARTGGTALGPDRGALHVLAAAGASTRGFFGPQDPTRTAPVGTQVLVRSDGPSCRPCGSRHCRHAQGPVCMDFDVAGATALGAVSATGELRVR